MSDNIWTVPDYVAPIDREVKISNAIYLSCIFKPECVFQKHAIQLLLTVFFYGKQWSKAIVFRSRKYISVTQISLCAHLFYGVVTLEFGFHLHKFIFYHVNQIRSIYLDLIWILSGTQLWVSIVFCDIVTLEVSFHWYIGLFYHVPRMNKTWKIVRHMYVYFRNTIND